MFWSENAGEISTCPNDENYFYWEVPNYFAYQCSSKSQFETVDPRIVSSPWFVAFNRNWRLALILNCTRMRNATVGFFLWIKASPLAVPRINVKLAALDCDGAALDRYGMGKTCEGDVDENGRFGSWTFLHLDLLSQEIQKISPAGVLTLLCIMEEKVPIMFDFSVSSKCLDKAIALENDDTENGDQPENTEKSEIKGVDRLVQNLKSLMLDEQSSDVVLKIEEREFKAHKNILKVRSPVFAAMFQPHTKESTSGVVDIPDCTTSAFEVFLLYVYTGTSDAISSDNVCDLYYAADKYEMNDLKSECVEFMENNLSVENFCEIMALCFQHSEPHLHKTATLFFCENVKIIIKTVQWQKFLKDFTIQANELFIKSINA